MDANIEKRMDEILSELDAFGEVLFGFITTNRNTRPRTRKGGLYVSPPHYTFNYKDEHGRKRWKRIPAAGLGRVRELVGNGKRWKQLVDEYEGLANRLFWQGAEPPKNVPAAPAVARNQGSPPLA